MFLVDNGRALRRHGFPGPIRIQLGLTTVRGELRARLVLDERVDLSVHRDTQKGGDEKELHLAALRGS